MKIIIFQLLDFCNFILGGSTKQQGIFFRKALEKKFIPLLDPTIDTFSCENEV
jgi:hypothetical protein